MNMKRSLLDLEPHEEARISKNPINWVLRVPGGFIYYHLNRTFSNGDLVSDQVCSTFVPIPAKYSNDYGINEFPVEEDQNA